jgi:rhamnogalacturonyl hydrolase YesR
MLRKAIAAVLPGLILVSCAASGRAQGDFRQWGKETLTRIQTEYGLAGDLYADEAVVGISRGEKPAYMWGCGVQLSALAAAARLDRRTYIPVLRRYISALETYWVENRGQHGYNVLPVPSPTDRFYDDNVWMTLALCETYEVTRDAQYRDRAVEVFRFVLSGEDDRLGGGIYWHEQERNLKGACSNGSATAAALRLYQITRKQDYLAIARRLYDWTNAHLQDRDGLFFDAIEMDGKIRPMKWSYNTALMLRANCLFYAITHEKKYLDEAERVAQAAEAHWVRQDTGAIADECWFAHLLSEAFLFLYDQDNDARWRRDVRRALTFLHDNARDPNGYYGKRWDTPLPNAQERVPLLYEASAARAYLFAARYP